MTTDERSFDGSDSKLPAPYTPDTSTLFALLGRRRVGLRHFNVVHGLLTAVALNPRPIPEAEWFAIIAGQERARSPDEQRQLGRLRKPVRRFYDSVFWTVMGHEPFVIDLNGYEPPFEPFYAEDLEAPAELWCRGFLKGTRIDLAPWQWLRRRKPELLRPIWAFGKAAGRDACYKDRRGWKRAVVHWVERLGPSVHAIRDYWQSNGLPPGLDVPVWSPGKPPPSKR